MSTGKLTKSEKKNMIVTYGSLALMTLIGILLGDLLFSNIEKVPPVLLFVGSTALLLFSGLGMSLSKLNYYAGVNLPTLYCYMPVTQEMVVYGVVRAIKSQSTLHTNLKKHNYLSLSSAILILCAVFATASPAIMSAIATSQTGDKAVSMILVANTAIIAIISVLVILAYTVRVIYYNYIFKHLYKSSTLWLVLAVLPPVHLVMTIWLHQHLIPKIKLKRKREAEKAQKRQSS